MLNRFIVWKLFTTHQRKTKKKLRGEDEKEKIQNQTKERKKKKQQSRRFHSLTQTQNSITQNENKIGEKLCVRTEKRAERKRSIDDENHINLRIILIELGAHSSIR